MEATPDDSHLTQTYCFRFCDIVLLKQVCMSPSRSEQRMHSRNGCFVSQNPNRRRSQLHIQREKKRKKQGKEMGESLFELLLAVIFLPGESKEWIVAQNGFGLLFKIVNTLFRPKYKLSSSNQARLTRLRYFNGKSKPASQLPRMYVFAAEDPSNRLRRRVYSGRLLPKLTRQATEIEDVKKWIQHAIEKDILIEDDKEKVYEFIRELLENQNIIQGQSAYTGYPSKPKTLLNPKPAAESDRLSDVLCNDDSATRDEEQVAEDGNRQEPFDYYHSAATSPEESNDTPISDDNLAESLVPREPTLPPLRNVPFRSGIVSVIRRIFNTARNDSMFQFICSIPERHRGGGLGLLAGGIMQSFGEPSESGNRREFEAEDTVAQIGREGPGTVFASRI